MIDASFLGVIAFSLAFLSLLIGIRMRAVGAPTAQIVTVIAELWAVFLVWVAVLSVASRGGQGYPAALSWFAALSPAGKALIILAILFSIAIFIHLQVTVRRSLAGGGGEITYEDRDKHEGER